MGCYRHLGDFPVCLPSCKGQKISGVLVTAQASGFCLLSTGFQKVPLGFHASSFFLTDGIFTDEGRGGNAFSNCTPFKEPLYSFTQHLLSTYYKLKAILGPQMQKEVRQGPDITI